MRRKIEGRSRVEAFDPRQFEGGGNVIEGDFTVGVVDTQPSPSPVMQERGGHQRPPEKAVRGTKNRAWFKRPMILVGSGGAVLGLVVAALLFDGGRQESVGAQSLPLPRPKVSNGSGAEKLIASISSPLCL